MVIVLRTLVFAILLAAVTASNAQWVKQKVSTLAWLHDVHFVNPSKGWIVGSDGTMLTTTDGGRTWTPVRKFTTDTLVQIQFTNENTGWMLCERNIYNRGQNPNSYLRKTVDGGKSWEQIEFENAGRERVTRLVFNKLGWGTAFGEGGIFYRLQEDGKTWKKSVSANHFLLLSGSISEAGTGALAGAGGTIMFTEDSGLIWEKATLIGDTDARINAVFFAGQRLGWAVGSNGQIFASTGGGRLWKSQMSGTTVNLNDVYFLDSRDGWAVGDDGIMLHTVNGGASWGEVNSRVKHRLERIYFSGKQGWAVGFGGTILAYEGGSRDQTQAGQPLLKTN